MGLIGGPDRDRTDDLFHAIQHNINRMIGMQEDEWER